MSDQKKPSNPARRMFGFDELVHNSPPRGGANEPPQSGGASVPGQPPGVSFGTRQPSPTAPEAFTPDQGTGHAAPGYTPQPGGEAYRPTGASPQYVYVQAPPPGVAAPPATSKSTRNALIALFVLAAAGLAFAIYSHGQSTKEFARQADQLNLLTRRADSSDVHIAQLTAKFDVTAQRLGLTQAELARARQLAVNIEKAQRQSVKQLNAAISQKASSQQVNQLQAQANSRFGTLSGSIAGTQKDLAATQEALTGAKSEFSGAIAHTHAELVALAHRTDRDYFEFTIPRKKLRKKIGPLQIELLKTDTKHNLFTANLYFDDKVTQRRNEALDEPVFFYMQGASSALELVVNKLGRNAIAGYVSAPKGFITNAPNVLSARPST